MIFQHFFSLFAGEEKRENVIKNNKIQPFFLTKKYYRRIMEGSWGGCWQKYYPKNENDDDEFAFAFAFAASRDVYMPLNVIFFIINSLFLFRRRWQQSISEAWKLQFKPTFENDAIKPSSALPSFGIKLGECL